jgi:hypothetical protein
MIRAIRLRGNLGNNLFQFALLRAMGETPVAVDDIIKPTAPLQQLLRPGTVRVPTVREMLALRQPPRLRGRGRVAHLIPSRLQRSRMFEERLFGQFDPEVLEQNSPVLYSGYFQHEDYFLHAADAVAADIAEPAADVAHFLDDRGGPSVALSIRAGADYQRLGWAIPLDWYLRAARCVAEQHPRPEFVVFSDVVAAADEAVHALRPYGTAVSAAHLGARSQLHVMAALDHAIIAPSSFAWWGAWLGDHRHGFAAGRTVIAPSPWVKAAFDETPSQRWSRLPVET